MSESGVTFVDGGVIGGPAWEKPNRTWLYLSGKGAQLVAACLSSGQLETSIIGEAVGKASALKMCYAAYTKGTMALQFAILAAADELGIRKELEGQWSQRESDLAEQTKNKVRRAAAKAWRYVGEMNEIAATFKEAGIPEDFHSAAAEIYRRIAHFKGAAETPSLEEVLEALIRAKEGNPV